MRGLLRPLTIHREDRRIPMILDHGLAGHAVDFVVPDRYGSPATVSARVGSVRIIGNHSPARLAWLGTMWRWLAAVLVVRSFVFSRWNAAGAMQTREFHQSIPPQWPVRRARAKAMAPDNGQAPF